MIILKSFGGFGLALSLVRVYAQSPRPELRIHVHLYIYSSVAGDALVRVEQETARIFKPLRVAIEWRNCPLTMAQR